jgi:hypothetical protein
MGWAVAERARLIFSAPNLYEPHQAAALARHFTETLDGSELVRRAAGKGSNSSASPGAAPPTDMADTADMPVKSANASALRAFCGATDPGASRRARGRPVPLDACERVTSLHKR